MKRVAILGSTGSVGRNTLAVVDAFRDELKVVGLAAGGNITLLAEQVIKYRPELVSVREHRDVDRLRGLLHDPVDILHGASGACAVATLPHSAVVIAAIVGAAGIPPVHAALKAGKRVGIANKEVLVAAGDVMTKTARENGGEILPDLSENKAWHQELLLSDREKRLPHNLTASGM